MKDKDSAYNFDIIKRNIIYTSNKNQVVPESEIIIFKVFEYINDRK